jgi:hypothetical protein
MRNLITLFFFEKNANFFAENCRQSQKIVILTSTPGQHGKLLDDLKEAPKAYVEKAASRDGLSPVRSGSSGRGHRDRLQWHKIIG